MNIYQIKWDIKYISSGAHGLCATVIAQNETDAIKAVELEDESIRNIRVWLIGSTTDRHKIIEIDKDGILNETNATQILCRECL